MKKIVLGCAAVLLSLGLLAGCDDNPSTVDAVIISVDTSASVIVGETLELPYSVEPEKATVVAASDHEEYVTADAQDGILYLHGVTEGSAIVTLVGTYKKYAEANVNINVSVVTEATEKTEPGVPDEGTVIKTGKLGFYNEALYSYYYFDGTTTTSAGREWGATTTTWEDAIDVTLTQYDEGETLSWVKDGTTYYLGGTYSSSVGFEVTTTLTYINYNETYDSIETVAEDYFLGTYDEYTTIGWCGTSYYDQDYVAHVFTSEPEGMATPTLITISGESEVEVGRWITLTASIEPEDADPRLTWSWTTNDSGEVTVNNGTVIGVTAGSVKVTATSVADEAVSGSIDITVNEATSEAPATYKLGALDSANYVYKYFNGKTTGSTFLDVSTGWENGADLYITAIDDDGVENSFTMSFINSSGSLKYIKWSASTQIVLDDEPYTWVWDSTNELIVTNEGTVRFLALYSSASIRAYTKDDQYLAYPHVALFETEPTEPEKPETPELTQVTSGLTDGGTYYIGEYEDDAYHLITGSVSANYRLETSVDFNSAVAVTATGDDENGWVLTLSSTGQYIYGYCANSYHDFGLSDASTVPNNGTNKFFWDSGISSLYCAGTAMNSTYDYVYFEWYQSTVCLYGNSSLSVSNAAHVYQLAAN